MQPPWRCRIPRNAPPAVLHQRPGSYWENSAASLCSSLSHCGGRSRNPSWRRHARRARSLFAQLCHIFAVGQNDGSDAEAGGRSQRQAEQGDPHVALLMLAGGSATGLSATRACSVTAGDGVTVRLIGAVVQSSSTLGCRVLNPLRGTRTMPPFELGLVFSAPPGAPFTQSNGSDERSRESCGRDQVCADKEGHDGYWHGEMVQPDERLWIHSAQRRRQRRIRAYFRGRAGGPDLSQRGSDGRIRIGQQSRQAGGGESQGALTATSSSTACRRVQRRQQIGKHFAGIRSRQQCRSSSQGAQKEDATRGRFS